MRVRWEKPLRRRLKALGMSVEEFGRQMGVNEKEAEEIIRKRFPRIKLIRKVCDLLLIGPADVGYGKITCRMVAEGLELKDLARRIGRTPANTSGLIKRIEAGDSVSTRTIEALAVALKLPRSVLLE